MSLSPGCCKQGNIVCFGRPTIIVIAAGEGGWEHLPVIAHMYHRLLHSRFTVPDALALAFHARSQLQS